MAGETATFKSPYDYLGFFGGLLFAVGFFPQIYKQVKTRSSRDISLHWLFAYVLALALYGTYAIKARLWPIVGPACLEFVLIWSSIVIKIVTDRQWVKREKQKQEQNDARASSLDRGLTGREASEDSKPQGHAVVELHNSRKIDLDP